jgi:hypothetical protein
MAGHLSQSQELVVDKGVLQKITLRTVQIVVAIAILLIRMGLVTGLI